MSGEMPIEKSTVPSMISPDSNWSPSPKESKPVPPDVLAAALDYRDKTEGMPVGFGSETHAITSVVSDSEAMPITPVPAEHPALGRSKGGKNKPRSDAELVPPMPITLDELPPEVVATARDKYSGKTIETPKDIKGGVGESGDTETLTPNRDSLGGEDINEEDRKSLGQPIRLSIPPVPAEDFNDMEMSGESPFPAPNSALPEGVRIDNTENRHRRLTQNSDPEGGLNKDIVKYKTVKHPEPTPPAPAENPTLGKAKGDKNKLRSGAGSSATPDQPPVEGNATAKEKYKGKTVATPEEEVVKPKRARKTKGASSDTETVESAPKDAPANPFGSIPETPTRRTSSEIPPPSFEKTPARKPWMADSRLVMGPDNSLRGKIDAANWASEKAVNFDELGMEKGWTRSLLNKLRIKMGWSKDITNEIRLHTVNKVGMFFGNIINNRLIRRKTGEITRLDRKIQREAGNPLIDQLAKENIARMNDSIEMAKNNGDTNMVRILTERRDEMVERGTNRVETLKMERDSLANQLGRYNERKIAILDNFVASVEMQTEKVRMQTGYHENVQKRKTMHVEMERMLDVMSQTENQVINLKKALATTKDKGDRWAIEESIRELKSDIQESKWKHKKYQRMSYRLGQFIDLTDKRTQRFDNLKFKYLRRRNNTQERIDGKTPAVEPPPLPDEKSKEKKTETPPKKDKKRDTKPEGGSEHKGDVIPEGTFDAVPESEPEPEREPKPESAPETKARSAETLLKVEKDRLFKKQEALGRILREFDNLINSTNESSTSLLPNLLIQKARELTKILSTIEKDSDFSDGEHKAVKVGGKQLEDLVSKIEGNKMVLKEDVKKSFIKDFNLIKKLEKLN